MDILLQPNLSPPLRTKILEGKKKTKKHFHVSGTDGGTSLRFHCDHTVSCFLQHENMFLIHLLRLSSPVGLFVLKRSEHDNLQTIRVVKKKKKKKKKQNKKNKTLS